MWRARCDERLWKNVEMNDWPATIRINRTLTGHVRTNSVPLVDMGLHS